MEGGGEKWMMMQRILYKIVLVKMHLVASHLEVLYMRYDVQHPYQQ